MRSSGVNLLFTNTEELALDQQIDAAIQRLAAHAERARSLRTNDDKLSPAGLREIKNTLSRSLEEVNQLRAQIAGSKQYAKRCRQLAACYRGLSVLYHAVSDEKNTLRFASMAMNTLQQIACNNKSKQDFVEIADIYAFLAEAFKHHPLTYQPLFALAHDYFNQDYRLLDEQPNLMKLEFLSRIIGTMKKNASHNHMLLQFLRLLPDMQLEADHGYLSLYPDTYLKSQLTENKFAQHQQDFQELKARHALIDECYRKVEENSSREGFSFRHSVSEDQPAPSIAPQRPVPAAPKRALPPPPKPASLATPAVTQTPAPQPVPREITHHIRDTAAAIKPAPMKTTPSNHLMYKTHLKPEDAAKQSYANEIVARLKK